MARACADSEFFDVDPVTGELTHKPGSTGLRGQLIFDVPGAHQFAKGDWPWLANIRIRVQAGGGGSGGASAAANEVAVQPGGSGGGYAESFLPASALSAVESVIVGAGGLAGGISTDGGNGEGSSFGGLVLTSGGVGAQSAMTSGSTPAAISGPNGIPGGTGQIVISGAPGGGAIRLSGTQGISGYGGASHLGMGGSGRSTSGLGGLSFGYGAGGGGPLARNGNSFAGVEGGGGIVILELFA